MSEDYLDHYGYYREQIRRGDMETNVPSYISENLNSKFDLREYQEEAVGIFNNHLDRQERNYPEHLLYHMATGSGKTLIMAANILELYQRGYRNFVFFVNSKNIIEKTKKNFLDQTSSKYLFDEEITLDFKDIEVNEVENFASVKSDDINIHFTTIQGLHTALNEPRENSLTYEEFEDKEIVLLSDEAHHINAATKSKSSLTNAEAREMNSWENTVNKILNSNENNILLEYTATANLANEKIAEKYDGKLIYEYSLKEFRKDKFSKEVNVLQADLEPMERAIQSVILSQYRRKVAEHNGIQLKPVVLMKSRRISDSEEYEERFNQFIRDLEPDDLRTLKKQSQGIVREAFDYFSEKNVSMENLVRELKKDFSEEKCISVNSKSESENKQVLVNSLEDYDNEVRVVFAVDKLNEGWDVLNLFDIVRLYNKSSSTPGPSKTTVKEAQLIGRGARYCPFRVKDYQEKYKRKYDDDVNNELRILEELYYHSANNPNYIKKLKTALVDTGIYAPDDQKKELDLKVKESFKKSNFWDNGRIFRNEQVVKTKKDIDDLKEVGVDKNYEHRLRTGYSSDTEILSDESDNSTKQMSVTKKYSLTDFGANVLRTAMRRIDFYSYRNLENYFNGIDSVSDFIQSEHYLSEISVEVKGRENQVKNLSQKQKLEIAMSVLKDVEKDVRKGAPTKKGTKKFEAEYVSELVKDKTRKISLDETGDAERGRPMKEPKENTDLQMDLSSKEWYVYNENYGTSEEKYLIKFIDNAMEAITEKYEDIYLIRNASLFKIHRFSDGKAIEPDFVMFLKQKNNENSNVFQLFVEPKGKGFRAKDEWKEDFLEEIENEYQTETLHEDGKFRLIGMPFYTEEMKNKFEEKLSEVLEIEELY